MQTSISHFDPHQLVDQAEALHTRSSLRHIGLELLSTRLPPTAEMLAFPAFQEDNLIIQLGGAPAIQGRTERRFRIQSQPGTLFIVPRGTPSNWQFTQPCMVMNIFPHGNLMRQMVEEHGAGNPDRIEFIPRVAASDPLILASGRALLHTLQQPQGSTLLAAETLAHALLAHMLRYHTVQPMPIALPQSRLPDAVLQRLIEYIHWHLGDPLSLQDLALVANLSPYHLARMFRASFGQTLHQYILAQRLNAARQLVLRRRQPLAEIAARLGFADQSHMSFHFKRRYGLPPGALAKQ